MARPVEECKNCGNGVQGEVWSVNNGLCDKCRFGVLYDYSNDGREEQRAKEAAEKNYEQNRVDQANGRGR